MHEGDPRREGGSSGAYRGCDYRRLGWNRGCGCGEQECRAGVEKHKSDAASLSQNIKMRDGRLYRLIEEICGLLAYLGRIGFFLQVHIYRDKLQGERHGKT